jgi:hypothetical protein
MLCYYSCAGQDLTRINDYNVYLFLLLLSSILTFSVLTSSAVDRVFESRSGQTKDYKTGICSFSAKHAALRTQSKDWLARNQANVSE